MQHILLYDWLVGRVKDENKGVFFNLQAFFAANSYIHMGYLAKKGFERFFAGWKWTSKQGPL